MTFTQLRAPPPAGIPEPKTAVLAIAGINAWPISTVTINPRSTGGDVAKPDTRNIRGTVGSRGPRGVGIDRLLARRDIGDAGLRRGCCVGQDEHPGRRQGAKNGSTHIGSPSGCRLDRLQSSGPT